jgi:hypothetical protein
MPPTPRRGLAAARARVILSRLTKAMARARDCRADMAPHVHGILLYLAIDPVERLARGRIGAHRGPNR